VLKKMKIVCMMNCCWQTVPHDCPRHRESSVTKFCPRTWNRTVGAGRQASRYHEG